MTYQEYNERKVQLDLVEWPDPIVVDERPLSEEEIAYWREVTAAPHAKTTSRGCVQGKH